MRKLLIAVLMLCSLAAVAQTQDSGVNPVANTILINQYDCRPYMKIETHRLAKWLWLKSETVRSITTEKQSECVANPANVVQVLPISHNLRTNGGLDIYSACLFGTTGTCGPIKYMAIGTGTADPAATDTALGSELTTNGLGRATVTSWTHTAGTAKTCATVTFTYTGSTSVTVTEVGMFNAASGGTLVTHALLYAAPTVSVSGNTIVPTYCFNF